MNASATAGGRAQCLALFCFLDAGNDVFKSEHLKLLPTATGVTFVTPETETTASCRKS